MIRLTLENIIRERRPTSVVRISPGYCNVKMFSGGYIIHLRWRGLASGGAMFEYQTKRRYAR